MQELQLLHNRLELLLKKYAALQAENQRLKETVAAQRESIEGLNKKLETLEDHLVSARQARSAVSLEQKDKMRTELDTVIEEIDKILATLNE